MDEDMDFNSGPAPLQPAFEQQPQDTPLYDGRKMLYVNRDSPCYAFD
jgi:hypothetical protein